MVREMVWPKGGAVWNADGQAGEDGEEAVGQWRSEGEIVRNLVDGEEEVLVCGGADDVGGEEEGPGEHGRVAEEVGTGDLERYDESDDVFCEGLGAAEFCYLYTIESWDIRVCNDKHLPLGVP